MVINVAKLKEAGVTVCIFDGPNKLKGSLHEFVIEVFIEHGAPPTELIAAIRELLKTPEYQDATVESFIRRIQTFQILEAIEATGKETN